MKIKTICFHIHGINGSFNYDQLKSEPTASHKAKMNLNLEKTYLTLQGIWIVHSSTHIDGRTLHSFYGIGLSHADWRWWKLGVALFFRTVYCKKMCWISTWNATITQCCQYKSRNKPGKEEFFECISTYYTFYLQLVTNPKSPYFSPYFEGKLKFVYYLSKMWPKLASIFQMANEPLKW